MTDRARSLVRYSCYAVQGALVALVLFRRAALRALEEAVRDGEIRHRATLQALPDMLFVLSRDGVYLDFYAPDTSVLYASPDRFLGKHSRDVMPPELAPRFERAFAEAIDSAEPVVVEYSLELASGLCEFESRIVRCGDDRLLSIVRDVTAGKASARAVAAGVSGVERRQPAQPDTGGAADRRAGGRASAHRARPSRRPEPEAGDPEHRSQPPRLRTARPTSAAASTPSPA